MKPPVRPPCPKCGAELWFAGGEPVTACRHCDSSVWVDVGTVLLHTALDAALAERAARRLAGVPAGTPSGRLLWLPFWAFSRGAQARMVPADSLLRVELDESPALAGHERPFADPGAAGRVAVPPNVPLAAALGDDPRAVVRPRLLHVPFWSFSGTGPAPGLDAVEGRLRIGLEAPGAAAGRRVPAGLGLAAAAFFLAGLAPRPPLGPLVAAFVVATLVSGRLAALARPGAGRP